MPILAASTAEIYADAITAKSGETVLVPVKIKGNPGIMGFKITVEYDKTILSSPTVNRGKLTGKGSFNDSIGVTAAGTFDVVWSNTENVKGDGVLFTLLFMVANTAKSGQYEISLSFSQPDTFNEAWEDVKLECRNINVSIGSDAETTTRAGNTESTETSVTSQSQLAQTPGSADIRTAVDIALGEIGGKSLDDVGTDEQDEFVSRTNEILNQLNEAESAYYSDVDGLKASYKSAVADEFVKNAVAAVDSDKISEAIDSSLTEVGAQSIEGVPAEKKNEFVKAVEEKLLELAPDLGTMSDKLSDDEAMDIISRLDERAEEAATEGTPVPRTKQEDGNKTTIIVAVAVVAVIAACAVIYIVHHITNKRKFGSVK